MNGLRTGRHGASNTLSLIGPSAHGKKGRWPSPRLSSVPGGTAQGLEERLKGGPQASDFRVGFGHPSFAAPDDAVGQAFQPIEPPLGLGEAPVRSNEVRLEFSFELRLLLDDKPHRVLESLPRPFGQRCFLRTALCLVGAIPATR